MSKTFLVDLFVSLTLSLTCLPLAADEIGCKYDFSTGPLRFDQGGGVLKAAAHAHIRLAGVKSAGELQKLCSPVIESGAPWLHVGQAAVTGTESVEIELTADANPLEEERSAVVAIRTGEQAGRIGRVLANEVAELEVVQAARRLEIRSVRPAGIGQGGVVSAATFKGPISPGSIISIFGSGMAATEVKGFSYPLTTTFNGTTLRINGLDCALLYLAPSQINAQAPMGLQPGTATVAVTYQGVTTTTAVQVLSTAPGMFMADDRTTRVIVQRGDGSLLGPNNPALAGENVTFYGTGIGPLTPALGTGQPAGAFPNLNRGAGNISMTIGGVQAAVDYFGLVPGSVGLMQLNVQVPSGLSTGDTVPVLVNINGASSQSLIMNVRSAAATNPVITSFSASATRITAGQSTTLSWNVSNATQASLDNGIGSVALSGSRTVSPGASTTYTLIAVNGQASRTGQVTIAVDAVQNAPVINTFNANPGRIAAGTSTMLTWSVANATDVSIDTGIGTVNANGSRTVSPGSTTTYTLTARNTAAARSAQSTVTIDAPSCRVRGGSPDDTYFIDYTGTQNGIGAYQTRGFTLGSTRTLVFRFVSDYQAQAAIMSVSQTSAFQNNQSFTAYSIFDKQYGTEYITLGPGSYVVGARTSVSGANNMRYELDYRSNIPGGTFNDYYLNKSATVGKNGGKYWQSFTIEACIRYLMDGANSGLETYIISGSELDNFQNGRTFRYYTDYSSASPSEDQPGGYEITLPVGEYYLCFINRAAVDKTVTYTLERWR